MLILRINETLLEWSIQGKYFQSRLCDIESNSPIVTAGLVYYLFELKLSHKKILKFSINRFIVRVLLLD